MTHSTKNAIELKCPKELAERGFITSESAFHDANAAHALMKAIEEAHNDLNSFRADWVERRTAEILESEWGIKL